MTSRRRLLGVIPLVALSFLTGCGDDAVPPAAAPSGDGPTFVSGEFGAIPIHPLAEQVGPKSTNGDVTAQSFVARNVSRDQLFGWYEERLDGWDQVEPPRAVGDAPNAATRSRWVKGDRRLIMTVSNAPTLAGDESADDDPTVQYSLSLEPTSRPLPADEGGA